MQSQSSSRESAVGREASRRAPEALGAQRGAVSALRAYRAPGFLEPRFWVFVKAFEISATRGWVITRGWVELFSRGLSGK